MEKGTIKKVAGPLVVATGLDQAKIYDVVKVTDDKLVGEVIEIRDDEVFVQVYEETAGVGPGESVYLTGQPLSVELGPGLISSIFDGIQRPLDKIAEEAGAYITRGIEIPGLDRDKKWKFDPQVSEGDKVQPGDVVGIVEETKVVEHKIMVPDGVEGKVVRVNQGEMKVEDTAVVVETEEEEKELSLLQEWPIRNPRPVKTKLEPGEPLISGQRVIDTFFPVAKGGTASIPGPFGSGKTVVQHQLSKWADADIVIFVGCGERGNEMTDVLMEFPELEDPKTGEDLMQRTILIANTSNMPVAAREASVYTGITLGEYYRDMGYTVALMADSTSRWAEALREMSARLEEMPGEEGYPAYLGSKIANFYERAGKVKCAGSEDKQGSLTVIGAVSPPGGDLSEPVTQNTLRVNKVFWSLDGELANKRHFPAISWLDSYSLYSEQLKNYLEANISKGFPGLVEKAMSILQKESDLEEIVRLVGVEALSDEERLILETAKSIREDFLQQNAFDEVDTYTSLKKQFLMLQSIIAFHKKGIDLLEEGADIEVLLGHKIRGKIAAMKRVPEENLEKFDSIQQTIQKITV